MKFEPYFFRPINPDGTFAPGLPVRGFPLDKMPDAAPPAPTFSEEELNAAKREAQQQGYLKGLEEGHARAAAEHAAADQEIMALVSQFADQVQEVLTGYHAFIAEQQQGLPMLALAIARKVAGEALEHDPSPVIETMARRCLALAAGEPKLVVTVHESLAGLIEERLIHAFAGNEDAGEIIISPDADIARSDCRIEWKHGSAERSAAELWYEIESAITAVAREAKA